MLKKVQETLIIQLFLYTRKCSFLKYDTGLHLSKFPQWEYQIRAIR